MLPRSGVRPPHPVRLIRPLPSLTRACYQGPAEETPNGTPRRTCMNIGSGSPSTDFALDILGRYVCNTFDEARANSDPAYRAGARDVNNNPLPQRGDMRPFDFVIIGGGTFGAAVTEHLWFRSTGRSERVLVLEAGPFFLAEHQQNLPTLGLGNEVWGLA